MILLPLSRGKFTCVDDSEQDLLSGRGWLASKNRTKKPNFYAYQRELGARKDPRRLRYLHRIIMQRILNRKLKSTEQVDHINGDTLDNRRKNLRICNRHQNQSNIRKIRSKTGFKGVVKYGNRYAAFCQIKGGNKYLGSFKNINDAANAYDIAALKRAGKFAATN